MTNEEIVEQIRSGINARDNLAELYTRNKGLIWMKSAPYFGMQEPEDVLQEAYFLMDKAVKTYDASKGRFTSWLGYCIKLLMPRRLLELSDIRIPDHMIKRIVSIQKFVKEYQSTNGHKPSDPEIMKALGITEKELKQAKQADHIRQIRSLDEPLNDGISLEDTIPDDMDMYEAIENDIDDRLHAEILKDALSVLTDKQRNIMELRMQGLTFNEVCTALNMNHRQQAQEAEKQSIKKIRARLQQRGSLRMLYEDAYRGAYHGTLTAFKNEQTGTPEKIAIHNMEKLARFNQ